MAFTVPSSNHQRWSGNMPTNMADNGRSLAIYGKLNLICDFLVMTTWVWSISITGTAPACWPASYCSAEPLSSNHQPLSMIISHLVHHYSWTAIDGKTIINHLKSAFFSSMKSAEVWTIIRPVAGWTSRRVFAVVEPSWEQLGQSCWRLILIAISWSTFRT